LRDLDARLAEQAGALAEKLSIARHAAADKLSREIETQLQDLGMQKAKFGVALNRVEHAHGLMVSGGATKDSANAANGRNRYAFESSGIDKVEFLVSPNPG